MRSTISIIVSMALGAIASPAAQPESDAAAAKLSGIHCGQHDYWRCPEYCHNKYGGDCAASAV